jgi:myxalamid-type polyketide synthase MxaB
MNQPVNKPQNEKSMASTNRLLLVLDEAVNKLESVERAKTEPIAIVGVSCRFPGGAHDPEAFWQVLSKGVDTITEVPGDRWNVDSYYDPDPEMPGKMYTRYGGFLQQIDQFDPEFFGISPREAIKLDPQQRLLLEVSWEALERAGLISHELTGSQTGVFVGITTNDYARLLMPEGDLSQLDAYYLTGNPLNAVAGRLSYTLGLQGPCLAIDTACSSSLVAVHLACQSLRNGECTQAIAAGVNLILSPENTIALSKAKMLSADGRCKTFDSEADGIVRGEGCGVLVLKRVSDAIANGDNILALIRGSAVNQDGASSGFTVPNRVAQEALIREALKRAKVAPLEVDYVEAHGTGTPLGDPIEVRALGNLLTEGRSAANPLRIGSVKTNLGHLESAAGVASLIKVVLSLQHQQIPPHLHLKQPNPYVNWDEWPIAINTEPTHWTTGEKRRIAGVSSFGASGTNAHVIVEEALQSTPKVTPTAAPIDRPLHGLTLSAKTPDALRQLADRYRAQLSDRPDLAIEDVCFTSNTGRGHFKHRLMVSAASTSELADQLAAFAKGQDEFEVVVGQIESSTPPPVAFLFTGQGSQAVQMGLELYETQPTFRRVLDRCDQILRSYCDHSLLEVLYPSNGKDSLIDQTAYTQPALFAFEYALCQLWQSWGIEPSVVMGHSVGEYVAACVAGVFSLEDGLKLIAQRGWLMGALPAGGQMVAVMASVAQVTPLLEKWGDQVAIAAINGPQSVVISGAAAAVAAVTTQLSAQGIKTKVLKVSHAFHSPLMESMLSDFEAIAQQVEYHEPQISLVSNLTGQLVGNEVINAAYWCRHLRQPVQFAQGMATVAQQSQIFLEVGPQPVLLGMGRGCVEASENALWLPSLRAGQSDWPQLLSSLAQLYGRGVAVDWRGFDRDYVRQRLDLPTYPFQRQRFWVETAASSFRSEKRHLSCQSIFSTVHPLLGQRLHLARSKDLWFEATLEPETLDYLRDHRIYQHIILPATAYLEMALAAAATVFKTEPLSVEAMTIQQPLTLVQGQPKPLQCALTHEADSSKYTCQIFSLSDADKEDEEPIWTLHAAGVVGTADNDADNDKVLSPLSIDDLIASYPAAIPVEDYYATLRSRGIEFGDRFQAIQKLWRGEAGALGQIQLPESIALETYQIHPVLLDACFQVMGAMMVDTDSDAYLPVSVDRLTLYDRPGTQIWSQVQLRSRPESEAQEVTADLNLLNDQGNRVGQIEGLTLRRVSRPMLQKLLQMDTTAIGDWLYRVVWQPKPLTDQNPPEGSGRWLVLADNQSQGQQVAESLRQKGHACVLAIAATRYQCLNPELYQFDPLNPGDVQQLLQSSLESNASPYQGIIHFSGSAPQAEPDLSLNDLQAAQAIGCGSLLHLVQAIAATHWSTLPRLWIVTRNTQAVSTSQSPLQLPYTSIWGLGRVIALEHPELKCRQIDLDVEGGEFDLIAEMAATDREDQVAYRQGDRYVARLVRDRATPTSKVPVPQEPFRLKLTEYGSLENLTLAPRSRRIPEPHEVEIEVRAVGLNFRDVLNALGVLKDYLQQMGIHSSEELPFGGECSGVVVALGDQVQHLQVGDAVIAAQTIGSLSSYVNVPADFVVRKPEKLSFEAAATIPTAFLTAYYGLVEQAKLQAGERVLIHAAAGGVGQAAVQIAHQLGATVWATASPAKWAHLQRMGVEQVMNSRTLDFAEEVYAKTDGKGIEVVLNSFNGEFIEHSLACLGDHGRFVEIGKLGIWSKEQMQAARPDVRYLPFDLLDLSLSQPGAIGHLLSQLLPQFEQGHLAPLPYQSFGIDQVEDAFRYMAQAKQVGKVVITLPPPKPQGISGEHTYLITGGLGALGLQVGQWLVAQGAKQLVLTSRRPPSPTAQEAIATLTATGATVTVENLDVSDPLAVEALWQRMTQHLPPLKGIVHAAGMLDDGLLVGQTWERFAAVSAAKVAGGWNLHHYSQNLALDFFVCFSSISSVLGSPGQGNYAAANAFLDGLMQWRQGQGLVGQSVNWGPWSSGGMAAGVDRRNQAKWAAQGITFIDPVQGLEVLGEVLNGSAAQLVVLPVDWSKFDRQIPTSLESSFLEAVRDKTVTSQQTSEFLEQLATTAAEERKALLMSHIRTQIAKVLGLGSPERVGLRQRLFDLGMDSLMAVELKSRLEASLNCSLRSTLMFDYPTVEALVDYLAIEILALETVSVAGDRPQADESNELESMSATVSDLSEAEAEALLLEELDKMNRLTVNG